MTDVKIIQIWIDLTSIVNECGLNTIFDHDTIIIRKDKQFLANYNTVDEAYAFMKGYSLNCTVFKDE